ncbi:MAG: inositol monophosphatase, partial [Deltaproteobacteria bacterium]|nr:inositol monophosphatase [Deltaproteobacteria bacterium]
IIDPLDGTVNNSQRYPLFSVSISRLNKGRPVVGVVYEPNRDELFVAEKGGGALLNDKPIRPSKTKDVYSSMIATGFAYNVADVDRNNMNHFSRFIKKCHALRRDGVASTDLCYTACGRYDGFWELFLRPWDIAAASLIVEEAGGRVSSFNGGPLDIFGDEILASNGMIHEEMLGILKE